MRRSLKELAELLGARLVGAGDTVVNGIASIASSGPQDLVFVEDEKNLQAALGSLAAAIVAGEFASGQVFSKPVLVCPQPKLTFARAAKLLSSAGATRDQIHPSAVIDPSARLENGVSVAASAVIGENVVLGENTQVEEGVVIGRGVVVGKECHIYPNVTIYPGTRLGTRVIVHAGAVLGSDGFGYVSDRETGRYEKFPQIGRLEVGDDVEIGANTTIDRGALEVTRIGNGTKLDNLVHVGHNCQIGENVVIAAQTGLSGSIVIEDNVVLGGQVGIGEHARIEEGVMLGGQGGVLPHKVLRGKGVAYWGTPAKQVRDYLKELAALARLARKTDDGRPKTDE